MNFDVTNHSGTPCILVTAFFSYWTREVKWGIKKQKMEACHEAWCMRTPSPWEDGTQHMWPYRDVGIMHGCKKMQTFLGILSKFPSNSGKFPITISFEEISYWFLCISLFLRQKCPSKWQSLLRIRFPNYPLFHSWGWASNMVSIFRPSVYLSKA